jgi:ribonuclease HI
MESYMLLSIDRLLQMISEGKNIEKIAEQAGCDLSEVIKLIEEARELLRKHEKNFTKRKITLKKKDSVNSGLDSDTDNNYVKELLAGAELAAIPVNTQLTMYASGISSGNPGHAGIGIVIYDRENRQVGKVSDYIGQRSKLSAEYSAFIRSIQLAEYFQVEELRLRIDSEQIIRQLSDGYKTGNPEVLKFIEDTRRNIKKLKKFKMEYISSNVNDKACFLARKAFEKFQVKKQ